MTLLLALANDSLSIVLGDRRLICNGRVTEDESNKVCAFICNDARVSIAYTGLAAQGSFQTSEWLFDALYEITADKQSLHEVLSELQLRASSRYSSLPGPTQLIAFLISGYRYLPDPKAICYLLCNFDPNASHYIAKSTLDLHCLGIPGNVIVEAAGFKSVLTKSDYTALQKMLVVGNTAPVILRKAVEIFQRVSKESTSLGWIGAQCNSAVIPQLPNSNIVGTYHSARNVSRVFGQDLVVGVSDFRTVVADMKFYAEDMVVAGPEIKDNADCWCGSGRKFKICHKKKFGSLYTRVPGFRKPMTMVAAFSIKQPVLSGRRFVVTSSFS